MESRVKNPKILRKNNKTNILFKLLKEGDKSRLQLSNELGLTTASITQISKELISENYILERGNIQRNQTGRREVLLHFREENFGAIGVNIEIDKTHISLCTYNKVISEKIFLTADILADYNLDKLVFELSDAIANCPEDMALLGIGIGVAGKVNEDTGTAVDSHGILPPNFPLLAKLQEKITMDINIINNVRAQARSLIQGKEDNFMLVKHSPGIGCAVVVDGKVVEGYNGSAGELGHTTVQLNGKSCVCGKKGCLETLASEKAIESEYFEQTGKTKDVTDIYNQYGTDQITNRIIDNLVERLALSVDNAATLNDPKVVMVTGGLFLQESIRESF